MPIANGYRFDSGMMFFYFLCALLGITLILLLCLRSQDMVSPKDPYIQVWLHEDISEVSPVDHSLSLTKNTIHFIWARATR